MNESTRKIVDQLETNPPASQLQVDSVQSNLGFQLPEDFIDFFKYSNGAEGSVEESSEENINHVILWPIETLLELNAAYHVSKYAPGIFIFGSSGGGEAYGFDTRQSTLPVVRIPFIGMELKYAEQIAPSFSGFLRALETDLDP